MSRQRALKERIVLFTDLGDVLDAMKNFALLESARLTRTQRFGRDLLDRLVAIARSTAFFPSATSHDNDGTLFVVIGSERGFCGDFNERILSKWNAIREGLPSASFIMVGSALAGKLPDAPATAVVAGAVAANELDAVLLEVVKRIAQWQWAYPAATSISVVAHDGNAVSVSPILPLFFPPRETAPALPALNLPVTAFVRQFIDHYVEAKLHDAFTTSLLAENRARIDHMTAATARVADVLTDLGKRSRRIRQGEITQEVETLLLASEALGKRSLLKNRGRGSQTPQNGGCWVT